MVELNEIMKAFNRFSAVSDVVIEKLKEEFKEYGKEIGTANAKITGFQQTEIKNNNF